MSAADRVDELRARRAARAADRAAFEERRAHGLRARHGQTRPLRRQGQEHRGTHHSRRTGPREPGTRRRLAPGGRARHQPSPAPERRCTMPWCRAAPRGHTSGRGAAPSCGVAPWQATPGQALSGQALSGDACWGTPAEFPRQTTSGHALSGTPRRTRSAEPRFAAPCRTEHRPAAGLPDALGGALLGRSQSGALGEAMLSCATNSAKPHVAEHCRAAKPPTAGRCPAGVRAPGPRRDQALVRNASPNQARQAAPCRASCRATRPPNLTGQSPPEPHPARDARRARLTWQRVRLGLS